MTRFKRNLGIVTLASAASFGISLALTPIMTRLYAPADYGTFAVVNNLATFIATLALMSLPNVLPVENRLVKRAQIGRAIVHLALAAFLLSPILVLSYVALRAGPSTGAFGWSVASLPLLVAAIAAHRLSQSWVSADGRFGTVAAARVVHPLVAKLGAIGASLSLGPHPVGLLAFEALGFAFQTRIMLPPRWRSLVSLRGALSSRRWSVTAGVVRVHRDVTFYGHASALLALGELTAESLIVAHSFSVSGAGLFSVALSMVSLPVQLVALATAPVIFHRFLETASVSPRSLFGTFARALGSYLLLGLPVYGLVLWKGPELFSFVLGEQWRGSGRLAAILAPALLLQFATMPLSSIFRVARTQQAALRIDALFLPLALAAFFLCSTRFVLESAVMCLAAGLSVHRLAMLVSCLATAHRISSPLPS
jgi:O-antigen/teichoic acid export membrane protein